LSLRESRKNRKVVAQVHFGVNLVIELLELVQSNGKLNRETVGPELIRYGSSYDWLCEEVSNLAQLVQVELGCQLHRHHIHSVVKVVA